MVEDDVWWMDRMRASKCEGQGQVALRLSGRKRARGEGWEQLRRIQARQVHKER